MEQKKTTIQQMGEWCTAVIHTKKQKKYKAIVPFKQYAGDLLRQLLLALTCFVVLEVFWRMTEPYPSLWTAVSGAIAFLLSPLGVFFFLIYASVWVLILGVAEGLQVLLAWMLKLFCLWLNGMPRFQDTKPPALPIGYGGVLNLLLFVVLLVGNSIKLLFHDSILRPADFFQIGAALRIVGHFVTLPRVLLLVAAVTLFVGLLFASRRQWSSCVYPTNAVFFPAVLVLGLCISVWYSGFIARPPVYATDRALLRRCGLVGAAFLSLEELSDFTLSPPKHYAEEGWPDLQEEWSALPPLPQKESQPDVIMIMDESLFDLTRVPGLTLSADPLGPARPYAAASIVSPRFGGGTASVEFEALTGMTNAFFPKDTSAYLNYFRNGKEIPSLATMFCAEGYTATAMHPNHPQMYRRDAVYAAMGFDRFLTLEDLPQDAECNESGFVTDGAMADWIVKTLEESDTPQFLFAVTIQNHTPYANTGRFSAKSDTMTEKELEEICAYAEGAADGAKMMGDLAQYLRKRERPAVLYVFGDHLPSLAGLRRTGFYTDFSQKYETPLFAYSTEGVTVPMPECISPNQLAVQAVLDSGIASPVYMRYLYQLRETQPVLHSRLPMPEFLEYRLLQYTLMRGEKLRLSP